MTDDKTEVHEDGALLFCQLLPLRTPEKHCGYGKHCGEKHIEDKDACQPGSALQIASEPNRNY